MDRLPKRVGGHCDPAAVTPEEIDDFVVCGQVAGVRSLLEGEGEAPVQGGVLGKGGMGGVIEDDDDDDKDEDDDDDDDEGFGNDELDGFKEAVPQRGGARLIARDRNGRGSGGWSRGAGGVAPAVATSVATSRRHTGSSSKSTTARASSLPGGAVAPMRRLSRGISEMGVRESTGSKRPVAVVSFRNLFERLGVRDGRMSSPADLTASISPPQTPPPLDEGVRAEITPRSVSGPLFQQQQQRRDTLDGIIGSPERMRPFYSPGPRGLRWEGGTGGKSSGEGVVVGGGAGEEEITEDFDSRVVDQALELSMSRKVWN